MASSPQPTSRRRSHTCSTRAARAKRRPVVAMATRTAPSPVRISWLSSLRCRPLDPPFRSSASPVLTVRFKPPWVGHHRAAPFSNGRAASAFRSSSKRFRVATANAPEPRSSARVPAPGAGPIYRSSRHVPSATAMPRSAIRAASQACRRATSGRPRRFPTPSTTSPVASGRPGIRRPVAPSTPLDLRDSLPMQGPSCSTAWRWIRSGLFRRGKRRFRFRYATARA